MPLFTGKGFSGAAQQGFQQGFAQIVQVLMQDRAAAIQKELEAQRLDGQLKLQKEETKARNELADKQIQAEGQRAAFTESSANNRLDKELLFRQNAASQASSDAVANRMSDQLFQSGEAAKTREANAATEQTRLQLQRDDMARQDRQFGEKMALDSKQFDATQAAQKTRDETAKSMQQQQIDAQAYEATSRILATHGDKQTAFVDSYMRLTEAANDDLRKTLGQIAVDPANTNAAAAQQALARNIADTPSRLEAARIIAIDNAQKSLGDDPAMQFMMRAAPEAVRKQLESVLPKAGDKPKEELKKEAPKPKERTDLGPLEVPKEDAFKMTPEERSRASRGESAIVYEGKSYPIEAPTFKNNSVFDMFSENRDPVASIDSSKWSNFLSSKGRDKYIEEAYKRMESDSVLSLKGMMVSPSSRNKIVKEAYAAWFADQYGG